MALFKNRPPAPTNGNQPKPAAAASPPVMPANATQRPAVSPRPTKPVRKPNSGQTLPPAYRKVQEEVQQFLANEVKSFSDVTDMEEIRRLAEPVFTKSLADAQLVVSRVERDQLMANIMAEILGYGPLQPLLDRDDITEVMVNGPKQVYIELKGKLTLTDVQFVDDDHVLRVIERIVTPLGRRIDESSPMVDARLPDGSRVNAIIPPLSLVGPTITIRKFNAVPLKVEDLIRFGSMTPEFAQFLKAAIVAGVNCIISGGTGSGKTTLLNVCSSFIPENERILTIEDAAELQLQQPHVVRLEARPANSEGKGRVEIRDLVINALRMRPDRIVVGECRGGEALDMLQAMNTGHDGSLTTVHSNSARDTLNRLETLVLMAGMELPLRAIRQQVASAIDLIVHQERLRDGSRKIVQASEVVGMEGDTIVMQDIFRFEQTGIDEDGKILGELLPTGLRPRINDRIVDAGIQLPPSVFGLNEGSSWY